MNSYGRGGGGGRSRYEDRNNQQFSNAQSTDNYGQRPPPPGGADRYSSDRRGPPSGADNYSTDRRPPPGAAGSGNREEFDRNDRGRAPYESDNNRYSRESRPGNDYNSREPSSQRGGYGNNSDRREPYGGRPGATQNDGRSDYPSQRSNDPYNDNARGPPSSARGGYTTSARGGGYNNDADRRQPYGRSGAAEDSRNNYPSERSTRDSDSYDDNTRGPPQSVRGGYNTSARGGGYGSSARGGRDNDDYNSGPPPAARGGYGNTTSTRGGGYGSSARGGRDDDGYGGPGRNAPPPPRGGGAGRGGYDRAASNDYDRDCSYADRDSRPPPRGGMGRDDFRGPPRGGGSGATGGYDRGYSGGQENGYGPPPTRGGRPGGYQENRSYGQSDSNDYGNRQDSRSPYSGAPSARGGFGSSPRGTFSSSGRGGNSSRYEDRRSDQNTGYGGFTGGNTGYGGFSSGGGGSNGYSGFDDGRKERTDENHAPRDYKPQERQIEDIFNEDKEDVKKNTATIFDADADVKIEEANIDLHSDTWAEMNLHHGLMENIIKSDYVKPRKIQQKTIPYVLDGFDVKCQGETGSGKTAAFLIPVIQKMLEQKEEGQLPRDGPICLIVAPTRELVSQIYEQAQKFTYNTGITVARAYGEYNMHQNRADIQRGCNILCGCIGRLMHFIDEGVVKLEHLKFLILDEADRMLMERNNSDILRLFNNHDLPDKRKLQWLMFSATLRDPSVMELTKEYMNPEKSVLITASCQSNKRVNYKVFAVPSAPAKYKYLVKYLKRITEENGGECPRTLIFVNKKINTDRVAVECTTAGFASTTIHGDRGQHLREEALRHFRSGKTRCLVATDVCARGVDIKEMDHVINYDLPTDRDGFIQRSGRTGRTHNGTAMSFYLENEDRSMATEISRIIQKNGQEAPAFLDSYVQQTDYNFGEPEEDGDNGATENGYGQNDSRDNGYDDNRSNGYSRSSPAPAAPWHEQQQPQQSTSNHEEEHQEQQPGTSTATTVIQDNSADDEWD